MKCFLYPSIISNKSYDEIIDGIQGGGKAGHHLIFYNIKDNDDVMAFRILHERMDVKRLLSCKANLLQMNYVQLLIRNR